MGPFHPHLFAKAQRALSCPPEVILVYAIERKQAMPENHDSTNAPHPPTRPRRVRVYVTPEEKEVMAETAKTCGLSLSAYTRNLALGYRPASILDLEETRKLFEVKADLGRLGGLLKLWLTDDIRYRDEHGEPIESLIAKITEAQDRLLSIIHRVDERIRR